MESFKPRDSDTTRSIWVAWPQYDIFKDMSCPYEIHYFIIYMGILDEFMREKKTTHGSEPSESRLNMSSCTGCYCHLTSPGSHPLDKSTFKPAVKKLRRDHFG